MHNKDSSSPTPGLMAGLEPFSRRGFLRAGAISGMALTAGCARMFGRREAPKALQYVHLKPEEVKVVTRLTEVMLPTEKYGLPSSTKVVPTVQNVDTMVGQMVPQTRELLGLGLWVFEHRPMVSFQFSRFSNLSDKDALAYIEAMQKGAFFERGLITTLNTVVTINYWRDARTWTALDYWGPVTEKWGIPRLGNAPLPRA